MTSQDATWLTAWLRPYGLELRGGWQPGAHDRVPSLPGGDVAEVVWMVGTVGSAFWPHFVQSACYRDGRADPLDRWSRQIGDALAQACGGCALYPFDGPPYWPFQQWADRSEALHPSPLHVRLHPDFGLWHAYRFALALPRLVAHDTAALREAARVRSESPCLGCDGQPCLSACPVQAFSSGDYRLLDCVQWLAGSAAGSCMTEGCLARRACPVGSVHRYHGDHAAFHMKAFVQAHR